MVKILIIDDEEDIRELLSYNLKKEGHLVFTAENGEVGLSIMKKEHPDLILLDVMMPGMDFICLRHWRSCKNIRALHQT